MPMVPNDPQDLWRLFLVTIAAIITLTLLTIIRSTL